MIIIPPERCFIDGVEYDQTVIQLRAEADVTRDRDTGQMVPYNFRATANIETANPALIARLFNATFTGDRIDVLVDGKIRAEASDGMLITESRYAANEPMASYELRFGSPIRVAVTKPKQRKKERIKAPTSETPQ